jgi:hypothetical protein
MLWKDLRLEHSGHEILRTKRRCKDCSLANCLAVGRLLVLVLGVNTMLFVRDEEEYSIPSISSSISTRTLLL